MKKILAVVGLSMCCIFLPIQETKAQIPIVDIIKAAVKKVIKALDLQMQRLQNKTIWLQNAQKTLENKMSQLKLNEIKDWVEKQRKLYDDYFQELWKVKAVLAYYNRVKDIIERQVQMVNEYKGAWTLFKQDKNFTAEELDYMYNIYTGMMDESLKSIDQLFLVVNAFATQMSDAKRLEIINTVSDNLEQQYSDLKDFNNQNKMLSIQRASELGEIEYVKRLYGISR
ncbi:conjugal transfer protein TraI [Flavihumibacter stibioxidans]|uniref:Conjugal transfer protein TraI n=1 Tax=Flavihumibacter stibioxidans TaxID=1834163 RepID=A0ABR7M3X6_9BACT|nr:conjugal transfer protein TraI [Flavihumibacter stibioxidans]MBC6489611.1 conjugal transfer protein TraI [Flavihumibacter stibioxidans]